MENLKSALASAKDTALKEGDLSPLRNFNYDHEIEDMTCDLRIALFECALEILPHMGDYAANDVISLAQECYWNDCKIDGSHAANKIREAIGGKGDEELNILLHLADFVRNEVKDTRLYYEIVDHLVASADSPWGYETGIMAIVESRDPTLEDAERLVEISKKKSPKRVSKFVLEIFERRNRYGDYRRP